MVRHPKTTVYYPGEAPQTQHTAIYVVYQPNGLLASTINTCVFLKANGISVVIAANSRLSETDRAALSPHVTEIMQRENIGYDFGAYRDGVRHVLTTRSNLKRLIILNDSIWFPLFQCDQLIDRLKNDSADMFGPAFNSSKKKGRAGHLQSYMISFGPRMLRNPKFIAFWAHYPLSSNRQIAIKYGEIGLSANMSRAGFTLASMYNSGDQNVAAKGLDPKSQHQILAYEALKDPRSGKLAQKLLDQADEKEGWREKVSSLFESGEINRYILTAHPKIHVEELKIPFLKKDRNVPFQIQRQAILANDIAAQIDPVILNEIRHHDSGSVPSNSLATPKAS